MSVPLEDTTACQFSKGNRIICKTSTHTDIHAKVESITCGHDSIFILIRLIPAQPVPESFWSSTEYGIDSVEDDGSVAIEYMRDNNKIKKIESIQIIYDSSTKKFLHTNDNDNLLKITSLQFEKEKEKKKKKTPSLQKVSGDESCNVCNISGGKKSKKHIVKKKIVKKKTRKSRKT